jgi:glycosyltransferase involved in cell wall biosynthesis
MSVDVVIPVFNRLDRVQVTLASLYKHTPQLGRLVLVDDASTDVSTTSYLRELVDSDNRVDLIVHGTNTRFSKSANDGIALTRSEYIALLNSDLLLNERWLESLQWVYETYEAIPDSKPVAVVGCVQREENGNIVHSGF